MKKLINRLCIAFFILLAASFAFIGVTYGQITYRNNERVYIHANSDTIYHSNEGHGEKRNWTDRSGWALVDGTTLIDNSVHTYLDTQTSLSSWHMHEETETINGKVVRHTKQIRKNTKGDNRLENVFEYNSIGDIVSDGVWYYYYVPSKYKIRIPEFMKPGLSALTYEKYDEATRKKIRARSKQNAYDILNDKYPEHKWTDEAKRDNDELLKLQNRSNHIHPNNINPTDSLHPAKFGRTYYAIGVND